MNTFCKWMVVSGGLFAATPAFATSEALSTTSASYWITNTGVSTTSVPAAWEITISCNSVAGDCAYDSFTPSISKGSTTASSSQLSLVFTGTNGPTPGQGSDFVYQASNGTSADVTITLAVYAPNGQADYSGSDLISGGPAASSISSSLTVPPDAAVISNLGNNSSAVSEYFTPVVGPTPISNVVVDSKTGPTASNYVQSVTVTFNAPEPISSSLFTVGVAGIGLVRRKRRPA